MFRLKWPWSSNPKAKLPPSPLSPQPQQTMPPALVKKHPIPKSMPYSSIVMSGGGLKGVSFVGCVRRLEELGMVDGIVNMLGTSFGSLVLFMLALGCTSDDMMRNIVDCVDESLKKNKRPLLKTLLTCIENGGIDDGSILLECIKRPLINKLERSDITFVELAKQTGKNLIITGSNLTKSRCDYFSVDTTPDMSVVLALRISASIPFIFNPVIHDGCIYVDGAMFGNFPIDWMCAKMNGSDTLGIVIEDPFQTDFVKKRISLMDLTYAIWDSVQRRLNTNPTKTSKNEARTIIHIHLSDMDAFLATHLDSATAMGFSFETLRFEISKTDADISALFGYNCATLALALLEQNPEHHCENDAGDDVCTVSTLDANSSVIERV